MSIEEKVFERSATSWRPGLVVQNSDVTTFFVQSPQERGICTVGYEEEIVFTLYTSPGGQNPLTRDLCGRLMV